MRLAHVHRDWHLERSGPTNRTQPSAHSLQARAACSRTQGCRGDELRRNHTSAPFIQRRTGGIVLDVRSRPPGVGENVAPFCVVRSRIGHVWDRAWLPRRSPAQDVGRGCCARGAYCVGAVRALPVRDAAGPLCQACCPTRLIGDRCLSWCARARWRR